MRNRRRKFATGLLIAGMAAGACFAQDTKVEKPEAKFYKLNFVVKEVEGSKVLNARTYSMLASTDSTNSIRAGEKVPVTVGPGQTQILDIGTNVDCHHVRPVENELALDVTVDSSGMVQETAQPLVRTFRWSSGVVIPLNKPTVIFSSDHASGKGQMQVELTAISIP